MHTIRRYGVFRFMPQRIVKRISFSIAGELDWPIALVFALLTLPRKAAGLRYSADLRETTYCLF